MDHNIKNFTFIWKIKNFNYGFNRSLILKSPNFFIHGMCWSLDLHSKSPFYENCISCMLRRGFSPGRFENFELDYEISFLTNDGSNITSQIFLSKFFTIGSIDLLCALTAEINEVFMVKKNLYLPDGTLTIRCKMWISQELLLKSVRCSGKSLFNINSTSFSKRIENFSSLKKNSKTKVDIKQHIKKTIISSIFIAVDDDTLNIEITPVVYNPTFMYRLKIFITATFQYKIKICDRENYDRKPFSISVPFSKTPLTVKKDIRLQNDVLLLEFEVSFPSTPDSFPINDLVVYEYDFQDNEGGTSNAMGTVSLYKEHLTGSSTTLKTDFISLLKEGILSDIELKTDTETFPAHAAVLSARSPIFKSMLETDMREKMKRCVSIEDMNADIVRKMLLFIHSDTLDDLNFENAKELYYAADKYCIVSLRRKCSNYLKMNLLPSNCCDVLLLADKHQDEDLKRYAQDCIAENDEVVLSSDDWKDLENNHPRLSVETFRVVYMKNRRA